MNLPARRSVSTGMHRPRRLTRSLLSAVVLVALPLAAAACGDDDEPAATGGDATSTTSAPDPYGNGSTGDDGGSESTEGTIVAEDYSLTDLTVGPGDQIVLRNDGSFTHTATADDGEFDLGQVAPGETSDPGTAPDEPGTYAFHCTIHASMTARLTVEG